MNDDWLLADAVATIEHADRRRLKALADGHGALLQAYRRWPGPARAERLKFAAEAFAKGRSPMELSANLQLGRSQIVPSKYRVLLAYAQRQQAIDMVTKDGDHASAHKAFLSAVAAYESMNERQNVWITRKIDTYSLAQFGDAVERWGRLIPVATASGYPDATSLTVLETARAAMRDQNWGIARSLLATVDEPDDWERIDVLLLQATAASHDGDSDAARRHLRNARVLVSALKYERGIIMADLTEAAMLRSSDRTRSAQLLAAATKHFMEQYARGAVAPKIAAHAVRESYLDQSDLRPDLVGVLHNWGDPAAAFAVSEQGRGRLLLERVGTRARMTFTAMEVQRSLASGTTLVSFVPLEDRLIAFTIDEHGLRATQTEVAKKEVLRLVAEGDPTKLYTVFFGSLNLSGIRTLVVVPGELLARVPFAALLNPRTRQYIVETMSVFVAPSATSYAVLSSTVEIPQRSTSVVGDPALDRAAFLSLKRLPDAADEVRTEMAIPRSSARARSAQSLAAATRRFMDQYTPGALTPSIAADAMRDSYLGQSDLHTDLVGVLHDWGDPAAAFAVSERGRGRLLLQRMGIRAHTTFTAMEVQRSLISGTTLVSFVPLEDRLITFTIDKHGLRTTQTEVGRRELTRLVREGDSTKLYTALYGSLNLAGIKTLVVVPDELLAGVPFTALLNPRTLQYALETTTIVVAPSATTYAALSRTAAIPRRSALVMGDPAFDRTAFPNLERLPAAAAEAREVAAMYDSSVLVGREATREALLERMADHDVLHLGAHVEVSANRADVLMTSPVSAHEVALEHVRRGSVVVLAGCRTGVRSGRSDVSSLTFAFLAAGSRSAVGTVREVEDETTRTFSRRLHQLLVTGMPVASAVRQVQLELRRRGFPATTWGAFQVYGAG